MDSTLELQKTLVALLKADATLAAIVGARVYDTPPQDPAYPYVSFGPSKGLSWDTDTGLGWDASLQIDTWSRKPGRVEAAQIMTAINAAVHRSDLSLDTQVSCLALHDFSTILPEDDGVTTHGVQRFRFLTHS
jgi:hypothetical protein